MNFDRNEKVLLLPQSHQLKRRAENRLSKGEEGLSCCKIIKEVSLCSDTSLLLIDFL